MWDYLGYGSSPVRWCEEHHTHSRYVVEWYNTLSNASFVAAALWLRLQFRCGELPPGLPALFLLLGLCSAWFHGTLSLAGQLADEMIIVMIVTLGLGHVLRLPAAAVAAGTLALALALGLFPSLNHKLMGAVLLLLPLLLEQVIAGTQPAATWKAWRLSLRWVGLSLLAWVLDMGLCQPAGQHLHFHAWWHVLVAVAGLHLAGVACAVRGGERCQLRYCCAGLLPATAAASLPP